MLTFTRLLTDSGLRHWDLRGPAGLIRFETHDVIKTAAVYLHATVAPGGADLEPCDVCGKCWHDTMTPDAAQALYEDWKTAAYHDAVIRTQLERWYAENLAAWAGEQSDQCTHGGDCRIHPEAQSVHNYDAPEYVRQVESTPDAADQVVPATDLPMLLAKHAPGLPYVDLGRLAAALDQAGYQVIRKATTEAGAPC